MTCFARTLAVSSCLLALTACSDDSGGTPFVPPDETMDAGTTDEMDGGEKPDSSVKRDAAAADGGKVDGGKVDGGTVTDAGSGMDAATHPEDSGVELDASKSDAATPADAAIADAATGDAGHGDAGHADAGDAGGCTLGQYACYSPSPTNAADCPAQTPADNSSCPSTVVACLYRFMNSPYLCTCILGQFSCN